MLDEPRALRRALEDAGDRELRNHFEVVWPSVRGLLDAFAEATRLPIFVFLNGVAIYSSDGDTMPAFCKALLSSSESQRCYHDAAHRVGSSGSHGSDGELCHAGFRSRIHEVETMGVGTLVITYGSVDVPAEWVLDRRRELAAEVAKSDPNLGSTLEELVAFPGAPEVSEEQRRLIAAMGDAIELLLASTVGLLAQSINIAHELSNALLAIGLQARGCLAQDLEGEVRKRVEKIFRQSSLGLYWARNLLASAAPSRHSELVEQSKRPVDLRKAVAEVVDLWTPEAEKKGITFRLQDVERLPTIVGVSEEVRRALHNVLSNAVKYSYHSTEETNREIVVRAKIPFDPAGLFLGIGVESFGVGVLDSELSTVFKPGIRGKLAKKEVVVGTGIGLSEVQKIMNQHGGRARIRSRSVSGSGAEDAPYLTEVDMIFPMSKSRRQ